MARTQRPRYKRILLKLSGEALQGSQRYGIDPDAMASIAAEVRDVHALGVQLAIVIGGGNIFRGVSATQRGSLDRVTADYMGMLATVMNGVALQDALEQAGVHTRVMTAIQIQQLAEPYIRRRAIRHLEKDRIVVFVGGTGNPYFTTDTTAALRATEIGAEVLLKATKVDGVYARDPKRDPDAERFTTLTFREMITKRLKVMDATAVTMCEENNLPIIVFDLFTQGNIKRVVQGQAIGTRVEG